MIITYMENPMPESKTVSPALIDAIAKNLNLPEFLKAVINDIAEPALRDAVAKSSTKIDDVVLAALYPILEEELFKQFDAQWANLLGALSDAADGDGEGELV